MTESTRKEIAAAIYQARLCLDKSSELDVWGKITWLAQAFRELTYAAQMIERLDNSRPGR